MSTSGTRISVAAHWPARQPLANGPDMATAPAMAWQVLERFAGMAAATMEAVPHDRHQQLHGPVMVTVSRLIERGRRAGVFRGDVPADWLAACTYALFHAAAAEVPAGRLDVAMAHRALSVSLRDLFVGGAGVRS